MLGPVARQTHQSAGSSSTSASAPEPIASHARRLPRAIITQILPFSKAASLSQGEGSARPFGCEWYQPMRIGPPERWPLWAAISEAGSISNAASGLAETLAHGWMDVISSPALPNRSPQISRPGAESASASICAVSALDIRKAIATSLGEDTRGFQRERNNHG